MQSQLGHEETQGHFIPTRITEAALLGCWIRSPQCCAGRHGPPSRGGRGDGPITGWTLTTVLGLVLGLVLSLVLNGFPSPQM